LKRKVKRREDQKKPIPLPDYSSLEDNDLSYSDTDTTPIKENVTTNDENIQGTTTAHC
jgi:hypothetical protein